MKRIFIFFLFLSSLQNHVIAEDSTMQDLKAAQNLKQYLSKIKSIAVEFEQKDKLGNITNGMLVIDKPYKFRCNYYKPFPILIVGNKNYVAVYDFEMQHFSRIKADENIFHFLLLDEPNFNNKFKIISEKDTKDTYEVDIFNEDLDRSSKISFNKISGQIEKIIIVEDDNEITVTLGKTRYIKYADKNLFILKDPEIFAIPERLEKKQIENLIK